MFRDDDELRKLGPGAEYRYRGLGASRILSFLIRLVILASVLGMAGLCAVYVVDAVDFQGIKEWASFETSSTSKQLSKDTKATPKQADAPIATPEPTPTNVATTSPSPTPAMTPTATPEPTPTEIRTATPEPTPAMTLAATSEPSPTKTPTTTPEPTPTEIPTATPDVTPVAAAPFQYPGKQPLQGEKIAEWVVHFTNAEREKSGLSLLIHDRDISNIAFSHSLNMIQKGYGHEIAGMRATDRAMAAGYDCRAYNEDGSYSYGLAENISRHPRVLTWTLPGGRGNAWWPKKFVETDEMMGHRLVEAWMGSPGHRANILDEDKRRIGVGIAIKRTSKGKYYSEEVYATQNFSSCE